MRNMSGQQFISQVNFQSAKHHRQVLREQIRPELIQKLQVDENPAANYKNAYRNVFKDELQKTMEEHYNKKIKDEYQTINDKMAYSLNPMGMSRIAYNPQSNQESQQYALQKSPSLPQLNNSFQSMNNSNIHSPKFRDYFEQKTNKIENMVKNNYDGGQQFFKVQDAYYEKRMREKQNYADFLKRQVQEKEYLKIQSQEKQNQEHMVFNEKLKHRQELEREKLMREKEMRAYEGMMKINQVEQERARRQRKSEAFRYNNISLHNPITNPIQYHIDNPYILKKIQDRTFK